MKTGFRIAILIILGLIGTGLVLVIPTIAREFTDVIIAEKRPELLLRTTLIGLAAIILRQVLLSLRSFLAQSFEARLTHRFRVRLFNHLQRQPVPWFDRHASGEIMSRVADDVPAMQRMFVQGIDVALPAVVQFTAILIALFWHDWKLTLVALAPLPFIAFITWFNAVKYAPHWRASSQAVANLNARLHDSLSGIRQIKIFTHEPKSLNSFTTASRESREKYLYVMKGQAITWPLVSLLAESGIILMIAYGTVRVLNGEISTGVLFYFLFAWGFFFEPISKINPLAQTYNRGSAAKARVREILDHPSESDLTEGIRPASISGEIRFDSVSFSYDKSAEKPTIADISFHAKAGETVALIGHTGAGKSTILHLVSRFYEPTNGTIFLDDTPLHTIAKDWLRERVGYVTQDNFLFNESLRANLQFGKANADDEEIWAALENACAADFVHALPDGLDTRVGERGNRFSGGEKQRLSIARTLLRNPPILLLDEATSALDEKTEALVLRALDHLRSDRTSLVIAHRPATIANADRRIHLDAGRIIRIE